MSDSTLQDEQARVAAFVADNDLGTAPEYRLLDLASEVGELAKDALESTDYGAGDRVEINDDEVGDALFALLALADDCDVGAGDALDAAIAKYESRQDATGTVGSGGAER